MEPHDKDRSVQPDEVETPNGNHDPQPPARSNLLPDNGEPDAGDDLGSEQDPTEEDDDNAYQNSDEALPDDTEERVLSHDPSREGGQFDEI